MMHLNFIFLGFYTDGFKSAHKMSCTIIWVSTFYQKPMLKSVYIGFIKLCKIDGSGEKCFEIFENNPKIGIISYCSNRQTNPTATNAFKLSIDIDNEVILIL